MKRKLFLFLSLGLFACLSNVNADPIFGDDRWGIISDNKPDGTIVLEVEKNGWNWAWCGFVVDGQLLLQYQDITGNWQTIITMWRDPNNQTNVFYNAGSGYVRHWEVNVPNGIYPMVDWYIQFRPPDPALYNRPIQFRVWAENKQHGTRSATAYRPNAPMGLTASNNQCNRVDLSWTATSNLGSFSAYYLIHRNGEYLEKVVHPVTSWSDHNAADGQSYNYSLLTEIAGHYHISPFSNTASGSSIGLLAPPGNIEASNNDCSATINLTWDYTTGSPNQFKIQRADDANFTAGLVDITVAASERSYADQNRIKSKPYYYRMQTKNSCYPSYQGERKI